MSMSDSTFTCYPGLRFSKGPGQVHATFQTNTSQSHQNLARGHSDLCYSVYNEMSTTLKVSSRANPSCSPAEGGILLVLALSRALS